MIPLLVVVGPTASGKTALAIELAERLSGEVVSADSVQVYRHFDIGSGKPTAEELARAPHHLLSFLEPSEELEANAWAELARARVGEILARGREPIVCGGTFLWIRALLYGLADAPPADLAIRGEHERFVLDRGRPALHRRLREVDPEIAARLHENDFVRVSRALEVHTLTGRKLSEIQAEHGFRTSTYRPLFVGVEHSRDDYDQRVNTRVRAMFAAGFVDEVRSLVARGFLESRAMNSVGYRQLAAAIDGGVPIDEPALVSEVVRVTKIFARRQRTWLREQPVRWLDANEASHAEALDRVSAELRAHLAR